MDSSPRNWIWRFGNVVLDERSLELTVAGAVVALEPKALELLRVLVRRPGEVVTKDELLEAVWPGRVVTEGVLGKAVAKLRAALGDSDGQLLRTAHGYGYRLVADVQADVATHEPPPSALALELGQPIPGRRHWILQRRLGDGGQGEVWLGEHAKTHEQHVFKFARDAAALTALKREATLFRLFRESLGERDDLSPVLDWNFDELPYFLESTFVPAGSLLDWCDSLGGVNSVPLALRIELVAQVADALAAAHGVGVLHKDLKPGNVLIQIDGDAAPRARLTDFGSGRLLDPAQLEALGITRMGYTRTIDQVGGDSTSGTPLYIAPEVLSGHAPTIRSDIYALGVMLWQLAIGDLRRPLAAGWEREVEDPLLRTDIANCIDGEPVRRLDSAAALARRLRGLDQRRQQQADLQRRETLASELSARLARARGRRRWLVALSAVLGVGLAVSAFMYVRLQQSQTALAAAAARADSEADHARAVNQFLVEDLLATVNPLDQGEGDPSMREVLTRAARALDGRFENQPATEAAVRLMLARSFSELGDWAKAHAQLNAVEDIQGRSPNLDLELSLIVQRASLLEAQGKFAEALALLSEHTPIKASEMSENALNYELMLALVRLRTGDAATALAGFDELVPLLRTRLGPSDSYVLTMERNRGEAQLVLGEVEAAYETLRANAEAARERYGDADLRSAIFARSTAVAAYRLGKLEEAVAILEYTVQILTAELGSRHQQTLAARGDLAAVLIDLKRLDEAEAAMRTTLIDSIEALGDKHPQVAVVTGNLAQIYSSMGRMQDAIESGERALALMIELHGRESVEFVSIAYNLARYWQKQERWDKAEELQRDVLSVALEIFAADHWQLGQVRCALAESLANLQRPEEALALLDLGLPPMITLLGPDSARVGRFVELQQSLQAAATARLEQEATPAR